MKIKVRLATKQGDENQINSGKTSQSQKINHRKQDVKWKTVQKINEKWTKKTTYEQLQVP